MFLRGRSILYIYTNDSKGSSVVRRYFIKRMDVYMDIRPYFYTITREQMFEKQLDNGYIT